MSIEANKIERYWDYHYREDEELSQSPFHQSAIDYLISVLKWLFYAQSVGIASNVNFYHPPTLGRDALSPDIAVVDGMRIDNRNSDESKSHWIGVDGPPPRVAIEISSDATWDIDLTEKVEKYAQMGIKEYFVFDPNVPTVWTKKWKSQGRFLGWGLNQQGQYYQLEKRSDGRIWSQELNSWLKVDDKLLRLYTYEGVLRLDKGDAQEQRAEEAERIAAAERLAKEAERQAKEAALQAEKAAIERAAQERQAREAIEKQLADLMKKMNQDDNGSEQT